MTVHALAHAVFAVGREQARDVILLDEIVEVVVGLENDAAAAAAVAAAGAALGHERFAVKGDGALAAVTDLSTIWRPSAGCSSRNSASLALTVVSTSVRTSVLPSLVLV